MAWKWKQSIGYFHKNSIKSFWLSHSSPILFISKKITKGSGSKKGQKLTNYLAIFQSQFSKVAGV